MKRMKKIAVAQQKTYHLRALFEDPAGLRIGPKPEAADCIKYPRARFPADLRAGIQHARNRSDAYPRRVRDVANRCFSWNRFHDPLYLSWFSRFAQRCSLALFPVAS